MPPRQTLTAAAAIARRFAPEGFRLALSTLWGKARRLPRGERGKGNIVSPTLDCGL